MGMQPLWGRQRLSVCWRDRAASRLGLDACVEPARAPPETVAPSAGRLRQALLQMARTTCAACARSRADQASCVSGLRRTSCYAHSPPARGLRALLVLPPSTCRQHEDIFFPMKQITISPRASQAAINRPHSPQSRSLHLIVVHSSPTLLPAGPQAATASSAVPALAHVEVGYGHNRMRHRPLCAPRQAGRHNQHAAVADLATKASCSLVPWVEVCIVFDRPSLAPGSCSASRGRSCYLPATTQQ